MANQQQVLLRPPDFSAQLGKEKQEIGITSFDWEYFSRWGLGLLSFFSHIENKLVHYATTRVIFITQLKHPWAILSRRTNNKRLLVLIPNTTPNEPHLPRKRIGNDQLRIAMPNDSFPSSRKRRKTYILF